MKRIFALIMLMSMLLTACTTTILPQEVPELLVPVEAKPEIAAVVREDVVNVSVQNCKIVQQAEPVMFEVDGVVGQVFVFPGQTVEKGDIVATLQVESMQEQLDELRLQLGYASSSAHLVEQKLELGVKINELKLEELLKANLAASEESAKALEEMETQKELLLQQIDSGEAQLKALEEQLSSETETLEGEGENPSAPTLQEQIETLKQELVALKAAEEALTAEMEAAVQAEAAARAERMVQEQLTRTYLTEAKYQLAHTQQDNAINMESLSINIRLLEEKIEKSTLYAPASGVITWISAAAYDNGWFSSEDPVMVISDPEKMTIHADWIEPAKLKNCERIYAWFGQQEYALEADEASLETDVSKLLSGATMSSTFHFAEDVEMPEKLTGLLFVQTGSRKNVVSIPSNALFREQSDYYAYKMVDNRRERVDVEIGLISSTRCEILSGLEEGDVVYVTE